jgi:hypothetical protein
MSLNRWLAAGVLASATAIFSGCASGSLAPSTPSMPASLMSNRWGELTPTSDAYQTTFKYVETFYPIWFTYQQWQISSVNKLIGPARMTPVYHAVVAPNDDTLYGNTVVDLTTEPLILTIPETKDVYSVLSTDAFGDINDTGITSEGVYGLYGPNGSGSLPKGVTPVPISSNYSGLIIRVDKYSGSGQNEKAEAELFRRELRAAPQSVWQKNHQAQPTRILPVLFFSVPFKSIADTLATKEPTTFLNQLQAGVNSSFPPTLTADEQALSDRFNKLFNGRKSDASFIEATRKAHDAILNKYLTHTGKTNWITFDGIGTTWAPLLRSAISEFIQYANSHDTAAYYQTFTDGKGAALDGAAHSYVLTFAKNNIPEAKRFWSVTAYTPNSITLIRNPLHKYLVGSYTPGLRKSRDGSISIYVAQHQPKGIPTANWLPVDAERFNLMLRVYGPEGRVKAGLYVPPPVQAR